MIVTKRRVLADEIVTAIKAEIRDGRYSPGSRLPTEAELCQRFGVSRPTVRAAVKELDVIGLVQTRHGVGTFVRAKAAVRDGLERLGSITESIRASGKVPGHDYARRVLRQVLPDEAERMGVAVDTEVLELRRRIMADGHVVAYSYDLIPGELLPAEFAPDQITGSIFGFFEDVLGLHPTVSVAEVHAVESRHIAWADQAAEHSLFILLDQLHYTADQTLVAYARTYFVEGAYAFMLIRRSAP